MLCNIWGRVNRGVAQGRLRGSRTRPSSFRECCTLRSNGRRRPTEEGLMFSMVDHRPAERCDERRGSGTLRSCARGVRVLADRRRNLFHRGCGLLQVLGPLLCALGQVGIAGCDPRGAGGDGVAAVAYLAHDARQAAAARRPSATLLLAALGVLAGLGAGRLCLRGQPPGRCPRLRGASGPRPACFLLGARRTASVYGVK